MKTTEELQTSEYWHKLYYPHIEILDPDGWDRSNFQVSYSEELITFEEFKKRLFRSSIAMERPRLNFPAALNVQEFYQMYGTLVHLDDGTDFYFMPFWVEKNSNGEGYLHHLERLPEKLKTLLNQNRDENNKRNQD